MPPYPPHPPPPCQPGHSPSHLHTLATAPMPPAPSPSPSVLTRGAGAARSGRGQRGPHRGGGRAGPPPPPAPGQGPPAAASALSAVGVRSRWKGSAGWWLSPVPPPRGSPLTLVTIRVSSASTRGTSTCPQPASRFSGFLGSERWQRPQVPRCPGPIAPPTSGRTADPPAEDDEELEQQQGLLQVPLVQLLGQHTQCVRRQRQHLGTGLLGPAGRGVTGVLRTPRPPPSVRAGLTCVAPVRTARCSSRRHPRRPSATAAGSPGPSAGLGTGRGIRRGAVAMGAQGDRDRRGE